MIKSNSSFVGNDTTSRLIVGIALFASALIEYKHGRTVIRTVARMPGYSRASNNDGRLICH